VQNIALRVLRDVAPFIREGITEREVAAICIRLLKQYGAGESWYHNVGALVLVGERTTLSASGKVYQPSALAIGKQDLVTIDLSPMVDGYWGDCARSYIVESGVVAQPGATSGLYHGIEALRQLHQLMMETAAPHTTMHQLFMAMNQAIKDRGYKNLDFRGNLGHSIGKHLDDRRYIEADNHTTLGSCGLFTFEPHICRCGDSWGFKMENIYYFEDSVAVPLGSPELLEACR